MTIRDIDYDIRKLNSLFIRIILIIVFIFIYIYNDNNYFTQGTYITTLILYIFFLILNLFHNFKNYRGTCRSILDLTTIVIFLYEKDLFNILNYLPFTILLFNIPSHSNRKSQLPFFIILLHLSIFIIDNLNLKLTHHFIPFIFYIFIIVNSIRYFFMSMNEEIISTIGDIFINRITDNNIYKILNEVKKVINDSTLSKIFKLEEIFLFKISENRPILIKGTKFLKNGFYETNLLNPNVINDILINNDILKEINVKIEDVTYSTNYWLRISIKDNIYLFLICISNDSFLFREIIIQKLRPVFDYIIRIYFISDSLINLKNSTSKILKQKITHVLNAQNALHYVRNKLSPITTSIDLMDRYFKNMDNLELSKKEYIEGRLSNNKNNQNINLILDKADILIRGVDNLISQEDVIISFKQFIDELRQHWIYHFDNFHEVNVEGDFTGVKVKYNQMLFDFVYTDLIENINRYSLNAKKIVYIKKEKNYISVIFSNKILDYEKNKISLLEIESSYNLEKNDEIYNRKTHGLNFIRMLLRRKNIYNKISIDKEQKTFNFQININILNYENTSI